jgi:hypothetical protein
MKIKNRALLVSLILLGSFSWSASATTYSGSDFSSMVYYNGAYVAVPLGHAALAYGIPTAADDDAVVGVVGPLGTLNSLNMSFVFSNPSGTGTAPFAAFGISDNSTWLADAHRLDVISMDGNQLIGTSLVHVFDFLSNSDLAGFGQSDGQTLNSILATYGGWEVMRAYAYIGDTGGASSGSVDINSITVSSVPDAASTAGLLGLGFLTLVVFGFRQNRLAMAK